ncbi:MAG: hypothetical protein Fur0022_43720 [Anaerolineales bacterium]
MLISKQFMFALRALFIMSILATPLGAAWAEEPSPNKDDDAKGYTGEVIGYGEYGPDARKTVPVQAEAGSEMPFAYNRRGSSLVFAVIPAPGSKDIYGNHDSNSDLDEDLIRVNGYLKSALDAGWTDTCSDSDAGDSVFCTTSMGGWFIPWIQYTARSRHRFHTDGYIDGDFYTRDEKNL